MTVDTEMKAEVPESKVQDSQDFVTFTELVTCDVKDMSVWAESRLILKIAIPTTLSQLCQYITTPVSLRFAGQKNPHFIGYITTGAMFAHIVGTSGLVGFTGSLDTLLSQEYGKRKRTYMLGLILQRGIIQLLLLCVPILLLYAFSGFILGSFMPPEIASNASRIIHMWMPQQVLLSMFLGFRTLATALNYPTPTLVANISNAISGIAVSYLCFQVFDLGLPSYGIAINVSTAAALATIVIYLWKAGVFAQICPPLSRDILAGWWEYWKLGIPSCGMVYMEWWMYELAMLFSGIKGMDSNIVMGLWMNCVTFMYMPIVGFGVGAGVRLGNRIGEGDASRCRRVLRIGYFMGFLYAVLHGIFLYSCRHIICDVFLGDRDPENSKRLAKLILNSIPGNFFDILNGISNGLMRGLGFQKYGFVFNLIGYWAVCLPFQIYMCFYTTAGINAIVWGLGIGSCLVFLMNVTVILRADLEKVVRDSKLRMAKMELASPTLRNLRDSCDIEGEEDGARMLP